MRTDKTDNQLEIRELHHFLNNFRAHRFPQTHAIFETVELHPEVGNVPLHLIHLVLGQAPISTIPENMKYKYETLHFVLVQASISTISEIVGWTIVS